MNMKPKTDTCNVCGMEFQMNKASEIEVGNKKYVKCPNCGAVVGLKRDDEVLSKGHEE